MATKRKWSSGGESPGLGIVVPPPPPPPPESYNNNCHHLSDYKTKHGLRGFRALQRCLRSSGPGNKVTVRLDAEEEEEEEEVPRCATCGRSSGRLYACLVCASIACCVGQVGGHARLHSQSLPGHDLAIDLDRAELFCCSCNDQVYDAEFDKVVVLCTSSPPFVPPTKAGGGNIINNNINTLVVLNGCSANSSTSTSNGPLRSKALNICSRRKARDAVYRPWVPSTKEQVVLRQGSTPLGNDSGLPSGLRGLNNMGNTCFMNSVLQALLHTPPLRNYFLSDRHNKAACQRKSPHLCLGCDMDDMFSAAFSGDRTPYSPAQFLHSWWQHAAHLAGYEQQDAHDFFISTVEGIHTHSSETAQQKTKNESECRCIVHRVFSGLLRSDVTCAVCGFTSTTHDPCMDISLDLETEKQQGYNSSSTLLGCLDRFTRAEKLGSNERFLCEACQVRQEAIKQMSIRKLPLVLCFHIKRFEHSVRNYRKVDRYVQFPLLLDMACYLSSSIVRQRHGNRLIFVDGESGAESSSNVSTEFELFAVVTHSGKLDGGHYVCYLRLAGQWYKCDDAWITRVSESVVRAAQAYMLYYVQKTLSYRSSNRSLRPPKLDENFNTSLA